MRLTFGIGIPDNISANLKHVSNIMTMSMSDIIFRVRIVSSKTFELDVTALSLKNIHIRQASPSKIGHREFNTISYKVGQILTHSVALYYIQDVSKKCTLS